MAAPFGPKRMANKRQWQKMPRETAGKTRGQSEMHVQKFANGAQSTPPVFLI
jgi:hypothetical protein